MTQTPLGTALKKLLLRWRLIVPIPVIVAFIAGGITMVLPTRWTSNASLEFPPMPSALDIVAMADQAAGGGGMLSKLTGTDSRTDRYIAILNSYRIRSEVSKAVPLDGIWPNMSQHERVKALAKQTRCKSQPGSIVSIDVTVPGPSKLGALLGQSAKTPAETAAKLTSAYVDRFQEYLNTVAASHERSERNYIEPQVADARQKLESIQMRREILLRNGPALAPTEEHAIVTEGIGKLEAALATAESELVAARREALQSRIQAAAAPPNVVASLQKVKTPEADRLQALLTDARARLYVMRDTEGKSDKHPDVRRELENIRQLETKLQTALTAPLQVSGEQTQRNTTYDALLQAYSLAVVKEASLKAQTTALNRVRLDSLARLRHLSPREIRELSLQAEYSEQYELYAMLRKALEEVKIREQAASEVFVVLDEPYVPEKKAGPSIAINTIVGFVLGIVICAIIIEASNQLNAWAQLNRQATQQDEESSEL